MPQLNPGCSPTLMFLHIPTSKIGRDTVTDEMTCPIMEHAPQARISLNHPHAHDQQSMTLTRVAALGIPAQCQLPAPS
jgi:hypothetical protein